MNTIDQLSFTRTTQQIITYYRNKYGEVYIEELQKDLKDCSTGNRLAIIDSLTMRVIKVDHIEREVIEDKDIIESLHETE